MPRLPLALSIVTALACAAPASAAPIDVTTPGASFRADAPRYRHVGNVNVAADLVAQPLHALETESALLLALAVSTLLGGRVLRG